MFRTIARPMLRPRRRSSCAALARPLLALALASTTPALAADQTSTWDGAANTWTSAHWSTPTFPHNGNAGLTYDASIKSGTVTLNRNIVIDALELSAGTLTAAPSTSFELTLGGPFTWTGGTLGGPVTVVAAGNITLSGAASKTLGTNNNTGSSLVNRGLATLSGGNLLISSSGGIITPGSLFQNLGTFNATDNADILHNNFAGPVGRFVNAATFNKSGAATTTDIAAQFTTTGFVNVDAGTLQLSGGGASTAGRFTVDPGATLRFAGGTFGLDAGSSISGAGNVTFTAGTVNLNSAYTASGATSVSGGAVHFNTPSATLPALNLSGGVLTGSGSHNISAAFNWTGGTLGGSGTATIGNTATLSLATLLSKTLGDGGNTGRTLVNNGIANLSGGNLLISSSGGTVPGSLFHNNGTFNASGEADISHNNFGGPAGAFANAGTFNRSGTGTTSITAAFNNTGAVNVDSGTLELSGGGAVTAGTISIDPGATLRFAGGAHTLAGASTTTGAGGVAITGGTVDIDGAYTVTGVTTVGGGAARFNAPASTLTTLALAGGTLAGVGSQTLTTAFNWTGGTLGGAGTTTVANTATLAISGASDKILGDNATSGRRLVNNGVANLSGGRVLISSGGVGNPGSSFQNNGTFNATDEADIAHNFVGGGIGTFTNAGTFNKTGAGTTTDIGVFFMNSGTVQVAGGSTLTFGSGYLQTAGRLVLAGGQVAALSALNISGGSIEGNGTIAAPLENTGATISPGPAVGTLTFSNLILFGSQAQLIMEIGGTAPGIGHDFIDVNNTSSFPRLDGDLRVFMINGFENAARPGDLFTLLTANSALGGLLANVASGGTLATADGLATFTVHYGAGSPLGANNLVLSNFAPLRPGDADLDGDVDIHDFFAIDRGRARRLRGYNNGDFNADGLINAEDYTVIDRAFLSQRSGVGLAAGPVAVPEPTTVMIAGIAIAALLRPRRRSPKARLNRLFIAAALACAAPSVASAADRTSTWDGTTNNWISTAHWDTPNFPNNGNGGFTYDAVIKAGNVMLNRDITIEALDLTGGTLAGAVGRNFTLTLNAPFTWTGGALGGTGTVNAAGGINLSGAATKLLGDGSISRTLVNRREATLRGGPLFIFHGDVAIPASLFQNDGAFNVTDDADISSVPASFPGRFANAGTFTKTGAGTTTFFAAEFTNTGNFDVDSGTLVFTGGGMSTGGDFAVARGAALNFGQHGFTMDSASKVEGAGDVTFDGTFLTHDGSYSVSGVTTMSFGIITLNAPLATLGTLNITRGNLAGTGSQNINTALNWTGGNLGGSGTTTVANTATLTISGPHENILGDTLNPGRRLVNNGSAHLSGSGLLFMLGGGGRFQNNGTFNVTDEADIRPHGFSGNPGSFTNAGTFNKSGAATTTDIGVQFLNTGTVNVDAGTLRLSAGGTSTAGTFAVDAGATLHLAGGASGIFLDNASAITGAGDVTFGSDAITVNSAYTVSGLTTVSGGTANFNVPATTLSLLHLSGGTLGGTGSQNITTAFTWTNGTLAGSGTTTIANTAGLSISGAASKTLGTGGITPRALVNNGIANLSGAALLISSGGGGGSVFQNNGTFNATDEADIAPSAGGSVGRFVNAGTFNKTGAGSTTDIGIPFTNTGAANIAGGATLSFSGGYTQSAGRLVLAGGNIAGSSPLNINAGSVEGNGSIAQPVNNTAGAIVPGPSAGTLTINNLLTLGDDAQLIIEVGGTTQGAGYDFIDVNNATGNTRLDGDLRVFMTNGFQNAATPSDRFTLLAANSDLVGIFDNVPSGGTLPTSDGLATFTVHYGAASPFGANNVVLSNFAALHAGDADGNGRVDILDFFAIDRGRARRLSGRANGEFTGDGLINAEDYTVIDRAFLSQQATPGAVAAAVPEPAALIAMGIGIGYLLGLRPRRLSRTPAAAPNMMSTPGSGTAAPNPAACCLRNARSITA